MKKYYLIILVLICAACVKTPTNIEADNASIFQVTVVDFNKPINTANIVADASERYTLSIKNISSIAKIDDGKQITVSVSDGTLAVTENFASPAAQVTLTVTGGTATCYYNPGRKVVSNAKLLVSIGSISQAFPYFIGASEPDNIKIVANPLYPPATTTATTANTVTLTTYLYKNSISPAISYVSDNLMVYFEVIPNTILDTAVKVVPIQPNFSYSNLDPLSGVEFTTKIFSTNPQIGTVKAIATYQRLNGTFLKDSLLITFHH